MKPALAWKALKKHAAGKPGAWEDHPWGETAYKAGTKMFVILGLGKGRYAMTCKLPDSAEAATTMFRWADPTGYGLGKSGWVTASFAPTDDVPKDLLLQWIDESYAAIAPKERTPARAQGTGGRTPGRAEATGARPQRKSAGKQRK
jgi:predicted DNA-binding protein (MmcQ/YjbR family)